VSDLNRSISRPTQLGAVLRGWLRVLVGIAVLSGIINLLYLTGSIFMLEIYDRVLPSRSIQTLLGIAAIAIILYAFQGLLDIIRGRILVRVGAWVDEVLSEWAYDTTVRLSLASPTPTGRASCVRDLDQVRAFLSGAGPVALCDLPWMPLYLGLCFLFHPLIGAAALVGAILLVMMTLAIEFNTRTSNRQMMPLAVSRNAFIEAARRNAEVVHALGMRRRLALLWSETNQKLLKTQMDVADIAGGLGAVSKVGRMVLQSAVLGVGAYLVIEQEATAGIIIASSILTARALAPVELAIGHWRSFVAARQSWQRLNELARTYSLERTAPLRLPDPINSLAVESISVAPPGSRRLVVQNVSFTLTAGHGLGIIGPTASGKSSLLRALVGVWTTVQGKIRLDGAALDQWDNEELGQHVGYLPQDVELLAGTVAQNIARFDAGATDDLVIEAAQVAGVHELILMLPGGYETQIGESGELLSAGQRQRIALARALYGHPFLVVLDEPNSNLDNDGDQALNRAIANVRARGGIVVVVAHRPVTLTNIDTVLVMRDAKIQALGPKNEVLSGGARPTSPPTGPAVAPQKADSSP
jgi:ATP-binding cassette subfamily C protein PrsD